MAELALRPSGNPEGLRGFAYGPEGSSDGALHRFVRFSFLALEARGRVLQAA